MKIQLLNKFYACLPAGMAFIVTATMFSVKVNAQIVYTDIVPDSTYTVSSWRIDTFNLDLNGDSTTDFLIKAARPRPRYPEDPYTCSVSITPLVNNAFMTTTLHTAKKLVPDDAISSSQAWHNATLQYLKWYQTEWVFTGGFVITNTGEWDSTVNGYVGLRLINGGQTYYGWVRIDVDVSPETASMTIKDYAYNSTPNQPILAGQTMTTAIIENTFTSSINLFPNPANSHITIDLGSLNQKVHVTIVDITGKVVYTTKATNTQEIEVDTKDFIVGIYMVQIQAGEFNGTKILVVK
jgi:hypothetical protein